MKRLTQCGLAAALLMLAGSNSAFAQDDPCADGDPCSDGGDMGDPCSDSNPCADTADTDGDDGAAADEGGGDAAAAEGTGEMPSMIIPKGKLFIGGSININMSADAVAKPISITPDILYGVAPKLDVGIYHSNYGISGFWHTIGGGLCLSGTDSGCADFYGGPTGLLGRYELANGQMSLAANGGLLYQKLGDNSLISLKAGVDGQYAVNDKLAIQFRPSIFIGLTNREIAGIPLNKEILNIPVSGMFAVDEKLSVGANTGIQGPLDGFGDGYEIPLNLGAMYQVDEKLGVGGMFGFPNIAGKNSTADARVLSIMGTYMM